jgi:thioester reductase-like protein
VIAKSEWTTSRMRMQKSGEELRESRAKSHRTANKFLQELLEKRSDSDLIDDNGAVDRYHKFVKYKSALNDDKNSTLDEFERRLRALNNNQRNQTIKLNNQNFNRTIEKKHQSFKNDLQPTIQIQNDKKNILYNEERVCCK